MSKIEDSVCADIQTRAETGLAKYGVTMERNDLSETQWLQHAYEEALDLSVYLKKSLMEREKEQDHRPFPEFITLTSALPTSILCKQILDFPFSSLSREKLLEIHQCLSAGTTKVCPVCLNMNLLELRTMNKKTCTDCGTEIPWNLEMKQNHLTRRTKMKHDSTICSKHDEIMSLASAIQSLCQDDVNPSDLSSLFSDIQDKAGSIDGLAADAKEDGVSMESGLDEKGGED